MTKEQLRTEALRLAQDHAHRVPNGATSPADVVARAEKYIEFLNA